MVFIASGTRLVFYFSGKIMVKRSWKRGVKRMKKSMDWEECWETLPFGHDTAIASISSEPGLLFA